MSRWIQMFMLVVLSAALFTAAPATAAATSTLPTATGCVRVKTLKVVSTGTPIVRTFTITSTFSDTLPSAVQIDVWGRVIPIPDYTPAPAAPAPARRRAPLAALANNVELIFSNPGNLTWSQWWWVFWTAYLLPRLIKPIVQRAWDTLSGAAFNTTEDRIITAVWVALACLVSYYVYLT